VCRQKVALEAACTLLMLLGSACRGALDPEISRSWESSMKDIIVDGSAAFRGDADASDDGIYIFSYVPPNGDASPVEQFRQHALARDACLKPIESSATAILLRCDHQRNVPMGPMEVRAAVSPVSRRLYVMYSERLPHEGYVYTFKQLAASSKD
jgi:hypothetical protein